MNKLTLEQAQLINFIWNQKDFITHVYVGVDSLTFRMTDDSVIKKFERLFEIPHRNGVVVVRKTNEMDAKWA